MEDNKKCFWRYIITEGNCFEGLPQTTCHECPGHGVQCNCYVPGVIINNIPVMDIQYILEKKLKRLNNASGT